MKRVLIVRLDAIGDYILWRNTLAHVRRSAAYRGARLTVLGNPAWRSLAEAFDSALADEWIWAGNRGDLFRKGRENLLPGFVWRRRVERAQAALRGRLGTFDEVFSPQPSADPLLDSLVDGLAPRVFRGADAACGPEFVFERNRAIAAAFTGERCDVPLELRLPRPPEKRDEAVFFAGASHWTRRWPWKRWRELEKIVRSRFGCSVRYAGIPGAATRPLAEFAEEVAAARFVVSNDTMALHLAAALDVPAVGVVNGTSGRGGFWPYPAALGKKVRIAAPERRFSGVLPGIAGRQIAQYRALASIDAAAVAAAVGGLQV